MPGIPNAVWFLWGMSTMLTNLAGHAAYRAVTFGFQQALDNGLVGYAGYLVVRRMVLSATGDGGYDVSSIPCLPGPMEEEAFDVLTFEEMDTVAPDDDPCRVFLPTTENALSVTSATLGGGCRGAFPWKGDQSGLPIGKALPPTAMGRSLHSTPVRFTREASPAGAVATTAGGSEDGVVDVAVTQEGLPPGADCLAVVPWVPPLEASRWTQDPPRVEPGALVPWVYKDVDPPPTFGEGLTTLRCCYRFTYVRKSPRAEKTLMFDSILAVRHERRVANTLAQHLTRTAETTGQLVDTASVVSDTSALPPRADSRALVPWVLEVGFCYPNEPLRQAEPGALVPWASLPLYGDFVASYWFYSVSYTIDEGERDGVLVAPADSAISSRDVTEAEEEEILWRMGPLKLTEADYDLDLTHWDEREICETPRESLTLDDGGLGDAGDDAWEVRRQLEEAARQREAAYWEDVVNVIPEKTWQETSPRALNFTAVAIEMGPWLLAASEGVTTFAWMSHYWSPTYDRKTGTAAWTGCWVMLCLVATSSQVLDGLFVEIAKLPVLALGTLMAAKAWWSAVLFLAELAWTLLNSALTAAVVCVVAAVTVFGMWSADQVDMEVEQQPTLPAPASRPETPEALPVQPAPLTSPEASASLSLPPESVPTRQPVPAVSTRAGRKARRKEYRVKRHADALKKDSRHLSAVHTGIAPGGGNANGGGGGVESEGQGGAAGLKERRKGGRRRGGGIEDYEITNWNE